MGPGQCSGVFSGDSLQCVPVVFSLMRFLFGVRVPEPAGSGGVSVQCLCGGPRPSSLFCSALFGVFCWTQRMDLQSLSLVFVLVGRWTLDLLTTKIRRFYNEVQYFRQIWFDVL